MATKKVQEVEVVEATLFESAGVAVGTAQDADIAFVRGYRSARDPALVEARKAYSARRIAALTAAQLAKYQ